MAINDITLGDDQPLSNDLKPIKVGGEASILNVSSPKPDGSDNGLFKVNGDLDITGTLKTKLSHDLIYDFDDEVNTLAQAKIDALVDSAPAALDTLNELAAALGDDENFATTITNSLATKVGLTGDETIAGVKTFTSTVKLLAGSPTLVFKDSTDDDDHVIEFRDESDNLVHTIRTNDNTGGGLGDSLCLGSVENKPLQLITQNATRMVIDGSGRVGIGVTDPDSKVEIIGEGTSNSTKSLEIKDSGGTGLFYVRDDGVVSVSHNYLYAQHSNGAFFEGSIKARGGITDDGGALGLGSDGNTNHLVITSGNITTGVWNGTPIASAYLDADTAHLSTNQTFTGRKNFNISFPQVQFTDDSLTDYVQVGVSSNTFVHKVSDNDIDLLFRNASNNDILKIDSGLKALTINDTSPGNFNFKIGGNGRMNMPVRGFEFENAHGYFAETGSMFLPLFINATQVDLIRFQTPLTWEYYDYSTSAYVDDMSNVQNLKNMLDGRRTSNYAVTNTKRKFRFVIQRVGSWPDDQMFYIENTWSSGGFDTAAVGGGSLTPTATIERLDGSFDASDDSNNDWTTNSGITTDWHTTGIWQGFGLAMYYSTGLHNSETHIRITVEFPEYADASRVINIKNIGLLSSYSSAARNQDAFVQDFNRNATGYGDVNIPTGHAYKINASSVLSATTLGSGVVNSSLTNVGTLTSLTSSGVVNINGSSGSRLNITNTGDTAIATIESQGTGSNGRSLVKFNTNGGDWEIGARNSNGSPDNSFYIYELDDTAYRFVIADGGNVGIGTTNPSQKLDVAGGINLTGNVMLRGEGGIFVENLGSPTGTSTGYGGSILIPKKGMYRTGTSSQTGAIKIHIPRGTGDASDWISMWVDVSDYSTDESFSAYIQGYMYKNEPGSESSLTEDHEWVNETAMIFAKKQDRDFTVSYGHDDTDWFVAIGAVDSTWSYLQVTVRDVQIGGGSDIDDYTDDWDITLVTDFGTTVHQQHTDNFPVVKGTNITELGTLSTLTVSGDLTVDTSTLKVDSSNNRVGIGTTSPSTELEVNGDITANELILSGDSAGITIENNTATEINFTTTEITNITTAGHLFLKAGSSKDIRFGSNNTDSEMTLDAGKLGIGTTSPTTTLDVEGTVSYKHTSLTANSDDLDVSGVTVVEATPSGTTRLGGLTGGVQGQILYILKVDSGLGRLIIEHNEGTGNQDIFLSSGSDVMLSTRGGMTLYCNGTSWFALDK